MGNENRRSDFDEENWQIVSTVGVKTILRNRMTGSLLDLYENDERVDQLPWGKKAEEIFEWRKNLPSEQHIPLLYHYQSQRPLIGSTHRHKIFTEHITRLSEIPPISKQEAFLVLQQIIEVLPTLYKQFGLFHVNVCTVGISESGNTKVWLNENLAKNYAETEDIIKNPSKNLELAIVNNLVRMLKAKVYNNDVPPQYPFSISFLQTLKFLKETRQRHGEYAVGRVYFNRSDFNQAIKNGIGSHANGLIPSLQICKQEPINRVDSEGLQTQQFRNKKITVQRRVIEGTKTEQSEPPSQINTQQHFPSFTFIPQQIPTSVKPTHQVIYFIPPPPFTPKPNQEADGSGQRPFHHNHNKTMPIMMGPNKERPLQQSIYLTPPPYIQQNPRPYPSPPKQHPNNVTPPKFLKRIAAERQRQTSPQKEGSRTTREHLIGNNNRPISLSPLRKDNKSPLPTINPISVRQGSINKPISRRELSRIVEQDQGRNDSFYMQNPVKKMEEKGFNVQLVESIYVKTNETDE